MSFQIVRSLGISSPRPVDLKLLRGDVTKFYFEIYALSSTDKQSCTYSINGMDPLVITFDDKETKVDAESYSSVYGTISVPTDAPIKIYEGMLTVKCRPHTEGEVSGSVVYQTFGTKFVVDVVEKTEERAVSAIPEKEKPKSSPIILVLIIIVLILAIVGFYFSRKKKTE